MKSVYHRIRRDNSLDILEKWKKLLHKRIWDELLRNKQRLKTNKSEIARMGRRFNGQGMGRA